MFLYQPNPISITAWISALLMAILLALQTVTGAEPEPVELSPGTRHPNLIIAIQRHSLAQGSVRMQRAIHREEFHQHTIVGTPVSGVSKTKGNVVVSLAPRGNRVDLRFDLQGQSISPNNTATDGMVRVVSRAETSLRATTLVTWDGRRLVARPTKAHCETQCTTVDVYVDRPRLFRRGGGLIDNLIRNTAYDRADEVRGQAALESSQLAETRLRKRMDQEIGAQVEQWNEQIAECYVRPLEEHGMLADSKLGVSGNFVALMLTKPDISGRAASEPADLRAIDGDFVVAVHETAVAGFFRQLLAGEHWNDSDLAGMQKLLLGDCAEELRVDNGARWSVRFDAANPVALKMVDGGFRIGLRGQELTVDGKALHAPWQVDAHYKILQTRTSVMFQRQSPIRFRWLDAELITAERTEAEAFLREKFSGLFRDRMYLDGLTVPSSGQAEGFNPFHIDEARMQGAWLYLISKSESESARPAGPVIAAEAKR